MEKEKINRINDLAKKSRTQPLTPEEAEEQTQLRRLFIEEYKSSLRSTLENTYLQRPDGRKEKLQKKK